MPCALFGPSESGGVFLNCLVKASLHKYAHLTEIMVS